MNKRLTPDGVETGQADFDLRVESSVGRGGGLKDGLAARLRPCGALHLADDEVDVWPIRLNTPQAGDQRLLQLLAQDEHMRAQGFVFAEHRNRFVYGRAMLRAILANYLGLEPQSLIFAYGRFGKPRLANPNCRLEFNLSHSKDLALLAVTRHRALGIDLEWIDGKLELAPLVGSVLSASELVAWQALPEAEKLKAFYDCWVRKEAYLKARGDGLNVRPSQISVGFLPEDTVRTSAGQAADVGSWSILPLEAGAGFCAALAVAGRDQVSIHLRPY